MTKPDMVNHPPHYTQGPIECIRAIQSALGNRGFLAYLRGCMIKYSWRAEHKGAAMEDMAKIGFYSREAVEVAGALHLEALDTKADETDFPTLEWELCEALGAEAGSLSWNTMIATVKASREAMEVAARQAERDAARIEQLESAAECAGNRQRHESAAVLVGRMLLNGRKSVEAVRGITFSPSGQVAKDIEEIRHCTNALLTRIGRV
jgi:hypothetical protein